MEAKEKILKRILAGTDFSRSSTNAVVRAAMLATEHSAKLQIVHVTQRQDRTGTEPPTHDRSLGAGPESATEQRLEDTLALIRPHNVAATVKLMTGDPAAMLVTEAERFAADLVVVGCPKKRSIKKVVFGTTAERLMERWTRDILIVRKEPNSPYRTILSCVALAPVSRSVVMSAMALSAHARHHILHVYGSPFEKKLLSHALDPATIADHLAATRQDAAQGLAKLLQQCPVPVGSNVTTILDHGNPSLLIPRTASLQGADVIVVGKNQSALERFFLGSVTKHVVRTASSDVLVSDSH
ncbi:MAG: universal stress protein [Syntrophobacteraceae bacterium]